MYNCIKSLIHLIVFNIFSDLFWKAPELLRNSSEYGTQKGDVYAFAIILYEITGRRGPFGQLGNEPKDIIDLVKKELLPNEEPFRPDIECVMESENIQNIPDYVISCIKDCWHEVSELRPDFPTIRYVP